MVFVFAVWATLASQALRLGISRVVNKSRRNTPFPFSPSSLHLPSHPRSSRTTLASALHPLATCGRSGTGRYETMLRTTSSGNRPMKGPCAVRAVDSLDGLRTLKRDEEVDDCPGLDGASGTHLFIVCDADIQL